MRPLRVRVLTAGAVALGAMGAMLVSAAPAAACSCGGNAEIPAEFEPGHTLAIVTRTDGGPGADARSNSLPVATFRVEDWAGTEPPAELTGAMDTGASCQPYVAPGEFAALYFERKDGSWQLGSCSSAPLGPALAYMQGDPKAEEGGPAVAYAAGAFLPGRLAAIDRDGRVVAYDRTRGQGSRVAVCPGGGTVVVAGHDGAAEFDQRTAELTVHDARTLEVRRTVRLAEKYGGETLAVRCADADAERVQVLLSGPESEATLVRVDGDRAEGSAAGRVERAQAVADGFVGLDSHGPGRPELVRITPDGKRSAIGDLRGLNGAGELAVSPDGRTVALVAHRKDAAGSRVVTIAMATGEQLGEWGHKELYVSGLSWTAGGTLLVRDQDAYMPATVPVRAFDRTLSGVREWGRVADEWAGRMGAVGEAAVVYGDGARLTATPQSRSPLVAGALRLTIAEHVVAASDEGFATGGPPEAPVSPAPTDEVLVAEDRSASSGNARLAGVLGGAAGAGLLAGGLVVLVRRRRRTGS